LEPSAINILVTPALQMENVRQLKGVPDVLARLGLKEPNVIKMYAHA